MGQVARAGIAGGSVIGATEPIDGAIGASGAGIARGGWWVTVSCSEAVVGRGWGTVSFNEAVADRGTAWGDGVQHRATGWDRAAASRGNEGGVQYQAMIRFLVVGPHAGEGGVQYRATGWFQAAWSTLNGQGGGLQRRWLHRWLRQRSFVAKRNRW